MAAARQATAKRAKAFNRAATVREPVWLPSSETRTLDSGLATVKHRLCILDSKHICAENRLKFKKDI
jgi:hypothetical protein